MSPDQPDRLTFATLTPSHSYFNVARVRSGLPLDIPICSAILPVMHLNRPVGSALSISTIFGAISRCFATRSIGDTSRLAFPEVMIVLRLIAYVFSSRPMRTEPAPAGAGFGMVPLSEIAAEDISPFTKLSQVFSPPAWWLHGHYGVPPERSLLFCRAVRHPLSVLRWLSRRVAAGIGLSRRTRLRRFLAAADHEIADITMEVSKSQWSTLYRDQLLISKPKW